MIRKTLKKCFQINLYKIGVFCLLGFTFFASIKKDIVASDNVILFWGEGCPHCEVVKEEILEKKYDKYITIDYREIYYDENNAELFDQKIKECNISQYNAGVPMVYVSGSCSMGVYDAVYAIEREVEKVEEGVLLNPQENNHSDYSDAETTGESDEQVDEDAMTSETKTDQASGLTQKISLSIWYIIGGIVIFSVIVVFIFKLFIKNKNED